MSIPTGVWTVIYHLWSELLFPGLPITDPLADQVLNHPIAEPKTKYADKKKEPPEDRFRHLSAPPFETSPGM